MGLWFKLNISHPEACVLSTIFFCHSKSAPYFITRYIANNLQDNFSDFYMEITQKPFFFQLQIVPLTMSFSKHYWIFLSEAKNNSDKWKEETNVSSSPKWLNLKIYIRSLVILITYGFHIFKITYLLKCTWPSKINTRALFMHRGMKVCCPVQTLSAEVW